ncbi:MAG TPA: NAD(P)H-hydrate dehydratase [Candidatus Aquilonibacter sp.]|nr:NAD(P)H-hydrate dehydratase [Candidatus Aquilonibacter sp.]
MPPEPCETITRELLERWPLPTAPGGSKEQRGRVVVVAGMRTIPGAALLAANAALRAGAGKLQVAAPASAAIAIAVDLPEALVMPFEEREDGAPALRSVDEIAQYVRSAQALVLGPGMAPNDACSAFVKALVTAVTTPLVLDASALFACKQCESLLAHLDGNAVLTPHADELSALIDIDAEEIAADPARYARDTSRRFNAVVTLKGAKTFIAAPDGTLYVNEFGHDGLATSGSGDVLAGVLGGLLARGATALQAAVWGVSLHALAGAALGDRIGIGFLARELLAEIPMQMRSLSSEQPSR